MDVKNKIVHLTIHNNNNNNSHKTKTFKIQKINNKIIKISKTIKIINNSNFKINKLQISSNFKIREAIKIREAKDPANLEQLAGTKQIASLDIQNKINKIMVLKMVKQTKVQNQIAQIGAVDFVLELSVDTLTIFREQRIKQTIHK